VRVLKIEDLKWPVSWWQSSNFNNLSPMWLWNIKFKLS